MSETVVFDHFVVMSQLQCHKSLAQFCAMQLFLSLQTAILRPGNHLILFIPLHRYKERRLLQGNHFEIFTGNGDSPGVCTLHIYETFPEDAGYYLAKATNAAGTALTEAKLVVEGKIKLYHCYGLFSSSERKRMDVLVWLVMDLWFLRGRLLFKLHVGFTLFFELCKIFVPQ